VVIFLFSYFGMLYQEKSGHPVSVTKEGVHGADIVLAVERFGALDGGVAEDAGLVLEAVVAVPHGTPAAVRAQEHQRRGQEGLDGCKRSRFRPLVSQLVLI
jgi:hypothetical protein